MFEREKSSGESAVLKFVGVNGYDVYNCSAPFVWRGKRYMYGRVEKPHEWARSRTMLFVETASDVWTRVENSMIYQTEDPNIAVIGGKLVLGGVFVRYSRGEGAGVFNFFYRGNDLEDMYYFTTGPRDMKDIRLVELADGKIGVFSRPRFAKADENGSLSCMGYTQIDTLDELCDEVIESARPIPDVFGKGEWGGPNQAYFLESGNIGIVGHKAYTLYGDTQAYISVAWVFDPVSRRMLDEKILATTASFPAVRPKLARITDCTFPSGICMRSDGKCDLYSGLSDSCEGRVAIEYPFGGYGKIVKREISE